MYTCSKKGYDKPVEGKKIIKKVQPIEQSAGIREEHQRTSRVRRKHKKLIEINPNILVINIIHHARIENKLKIADIDDILHPRSW